MAALKDTTRLAEVDYLISAYFHTHLAPLMDRERDRLQAAQARELADYQLSFGGIMHSVATAHTTPGALVDSGVQRLQFTGEHNSKTAEDYFAACQASIAGNESFQNDLARIASEWRTTIINEVGRERYDAVSEALGADLALAYVDERIGELMLGKMVRDEMPRSTAEYIIKNGVEGSLFGLPLVMQKSSFQEELDARGEAMYRPSTTEKLATRGVSLGTDIVSTGGVGSWSALARWVGLEAGMAGIGAYLESTNGSNEALTAEECISKALLDSNTNRFDAIRAEHGLLKDYEHPYLSDVNTTLINKLYVSTEKPLWEVSYDFTKPAWEQQSPALQLPQQEPRPDIPLVILPGHEQEYLDIMAEQEAAKEAPIETYSTEVEEVQEQEPEPVTEQVQEPTTEPVHEDNSQGWNSMLQAIGLDNLGDIGRNLPYVLATLPDMLVGLFTGKTQSVGLKKDIVPIASILLGMFVKNPLLKMVLIGMGGANLLNKMGHESIDRMQPQTQYRQYADEPLNPRIVNPMLQGNMLIATIDGVPSTVTIPQHAAEAYKAGALPLNTLCNVILARNDSMQELARQNYIASVGQTDQTRVITR